MNSNISFKRKYFLFKLRVFLCISLAITTSIAFKQSSTKLNATTVAVGIAEW